MNVIGSRAGKTVLVFALAAAAGQLLQAQLPQAVGTWLVRGAVADARVGAAAVTLEDGRTLIAGGQLADGSVSDSVVIYDPVSNASAAAGQLLAPRVNAAATLLADGRVLVSGGLVGGVPSGDVEIFDLTAGTSAFAATLAAPRAWHASARLFDDTVLIVGGTSTDGTALAVAEIFDPEASAIYPAGAMSAARAGASATTMIDKRVLIAGGHDGAQDLATAEIYDAYTSAFTPVPTQMTVARSGHSALLLPHNGSVLLAGGIAAGSMVTTTDLFLPAILPDPYSWGVGSFAPTGSLVTPRAFALGGALGDNGFAYVAGGGSAEAEAYRFATIKTDKDDYAPGELAIITGSGWQPGEVVTLTFQEDPAVHEDYLLTLTADALGNVYWDQWAPEEHDLNVRFYLTAQGAVSRAQMTFTDGRLINSVTLNGSSSVTVAPSATISASVTVTTDGAGANNRWRSTAWRIAAAPGTVACIDHTNEDTIGTFNKVLSITAPASPGTYNAYFTAHADDTCGSAGGGASGLFTMTAAVVVTAPNANTTTSASNSTATYGDLSVALAATVSSTSAVNVGTMVFTVRQGATTIGTATTSGTVTAGSASVTYALPAGTGAGSYTVEASYSGGTGFNASVGTAVLTIGPKAVTVLTQPASKIYGAADPSPLTTADLTVFLAADTITATFARAAGETVGPYAITTTLVDPNSRLGNYTVTNAGATFTITAKPVTVLTQPASKIYGEADPNPLTTADLSAFLPADGITATFARAPGDNVGPYAITTTLVDPNSRLGNYTVTNAGATFTITAKPVTVVTQPASKIYGADDPSPLTTADLGVFLAADTITATVARAPGETVGPYAITTTLVDPQGKLANYTVTNAGATFTINARPVTVLTQNASKIYGADDPSPLTSADLTVFLAADTITATVARAAGETVGPYAITTTLVDPQGKLGNYTVTNAGATFTINARPVTVITQPASKTYGDGDPTPLTTADVTVFLAADTITASFARAPGETVGPYAITTTLVDPQGKLGNYTVTNAGATFTINQRLLTVTATGVNRLYDGTTVATVNLSHNALAGDDVTVAYVTASFADKHVGGGKPVSVTGISITDSGDAGNYTLNGVTVASTTADISPRPLSLTAVPDSRVYNGTMSSVGMPTVGTLYDTDTVTGLVQTFDSKTVGTGKMLTVSAFTINDGNGGGNYTVTLVPSTAGVVTQRELTVTGITANNKPFDGNTTATLNLGGATLVNAIAGDSIALNTAGATGTFSSPAVGTWPVTIAGLTLSGADQGNYSLTQPSTTASITAWSLTGFYSPVGITNTYAGTPPAIPGVWNTIKGGQAVPFKFNLYTTTGGTQLTSVSDVQSFSLALLACTTGAEDPVEPDFTTTGATSLRYTDGQFIQNWATPKGANKCYRVTMTAADGSLLSAFFKTK